MATMSTETSSNSRRASAAAENHAEKAYDELQQAAGKLKQAARATGRELQSVAEQELEMARGNARSMQRRAALMIRRRPWAAVGAALLVGVVASRFL